MPEVAKTTGFERGGGEVFALDMTILLQEIVVDCGKIECSGQNRQTTRVVSDALPMMSELQ